MEFIQVFNNQRDHLEMRGNKPAYMDLENEASPAFQWELLSKEICYQLAHQGMHHSNSSERAIIKFKYHCITGIFLKDPNVTIRNW